MSELPPHRVTTLTIDIGADGGRLTIDQSQPVTRYQINDEPADEASAWEWIYRWHTKRDEALGSEPCGCAPCTWYGRELRRKETGDAG